MFHITSSLFGGLAAVTAWALVAPSFDPAAKASIAADTHERVNRVAKADRIARPRALPDRSAQQRHRDLEGLRAAAADRAREPAQHAREDRGAAQPRRGARG